MADANQPEQPLPSVLTLKNDLHEILEKISKFAHKNGCENFGKYFDKGIQALSEESFTDSDGYKIFPTNYATLEHQQLLNASKSAWVFGGMGSWNDMGFSEDDIQKEYEELSDSLFNLINLSLLVASSPFPRPSGGEKKWWQIWKNG